MAISLSSDYTEARIKDLDDQLKAVPKFPPNAISHEAGAAEYDKARKEGLPLAEKAGIKGFDTTFTEGGKINAVIGGTSPNPDWLNFKSAQPEVFERLSANATHKFNKLFIEKLKASSGVSEFREVYEAVKEALAANPTKDVASILKDEDLDIDTSPVRLSNIQILIKEIEYQLRKEKSDKDDDAAASLLTSKSGGSVKKDNPVTPAKSSSGAISVKQFSYKTSQNLNDIDVEIYADDKLIKTSKFSAVTFTTKTAEDSAKFSAEKFGVLDSQNNLYKLDAGTSTSDATPSSVVSTQADASSSKDKGPAKPSQVVAGQPGGSATAGSTQVKTNAATTQNSIGEINKGLAAKTEPAKVEVVTNTPNVNVNVSSPKNITDINQILANPGEALENVNSDDDLDKILNGLGELSKRQPETPKQADAQVVKAPVAPAKGKKGKKSKAATAKPSEQVAPAEKSAPVTTSQGVLNDGSISKVEGFFRTDTQLSEPTDLYGEPLSSPSSTVSTEINNTKTTNKTNVTNIATANAELVKAGSKTKNKGSKTIADVNKELAGPSAPNPEQDLVALFTSIFGKDQSDESGNSETQLPISGGSAKVETKSPISKETTRKIMNPPNPVVTGLTGIDNKIGQANKNLTSINSNLSNVSTPSSTVNNTAGSSISTINNSLASDANSNQTASAGKPEDDKKKDASHGGMEDLYNIMLQLHADLTTNGIKLRQI